MGMQAPADDRPRAWRGRKYRAAIALYVLAGATGVLCLALAVSGLRSARRLDEQLARGARTQGELLARSFGQEAFFAGNLSQNLTFARYLGSGETVGPRSPAALALAYAEALACKCGAVIPEVGGFFAWTSRAPTRLAHRGVSPTARAMMIPKLQQIGRDFDGAVGFLILKADTSSHEVLAPIVVLRRGADVEVLGYFGTPQSYGDSVLTPALRRVARARFGASADSMLAWRVTSSGGTIVSQHGTFDETSPFISGLLLRVPFAPDSVSHEEVLAMLRVGSSGQWQLDPRENPYRLVVQVHVPAFARSIYGGAPTSSAALFALLAAALTMTLGTALLARRLVAHIQEREAFTTAVAHDLRTPLTQILLFGESMQLDRPAVRSREEAARVIVRETRRLIHMVENALAFARGDRARPSLAIAPIDLGATIGETVDGLRLLLERAGVAVRTALQPGVEVSADRTAIAQIVTNLIENAVRFGPTGQLVQVTLETRDRSAVLCVEDEGPGIAAAQRDEVFRPFVRTGQSPGIGIGLAVSRQLAELMGGTLRVVDSVIGCRVELRLPLRTDAGAPP